MSVDGPRGRRSIPVLRHRPHRYSRFQALETVPAPGMLGTASAAKKDFDEDLVQCRLDAQAKAIAELKQARPPPPHPPAVWTTGQWVGPSYLAWWVVVPTMAGGST